MGIDESKYETMKIVRCTKCKNVYVSPISTIPQCPECQSGAVQKFVPGSDGDVRPNINKAADK